MKCIGGWSMNLNMKPLEEFSVIMYGMVTNLEGLTTGTADAPGWSPKKSRAPQCKGNCKVLWTYGGGGCLPYRRPATLQEVKRIVDVTQANNWDGVDFDDECNMNISNIILAMENLKEEGKETSYGFIAGSDYNNGDATLNEKVKAIINCGNCDRLVHYCYGNAMWPDIVIHNNVRAALERTLDYGMPSKKVILALTSAGLNNENLNYFLDQVVELDLGGLFIWAYQNLTKDQRKIIINKLSP